VIIRRNEADLSPNYARITSGVNQEDKNMTKLETETGSLQLPRLAEVREAINSRTQTNKEVAPSWAKFFLWCQVVFQADQAPAGLRQGLLELTGHLLSFTEWGTHGVDLSDEGYWDLVCRDAAGLRPLIEQLADLKDSDPVFYSTSAVGFHQWLVANLQN
jgi:hypothetical protein